MDRTDEIVLIGELKLKSIRASNIIDKYSLGLGLPLLLEEIVEGLETLEESKLKGNTVPPILPFA